MLLIYPGNCYLLKEQFRRKSYLVGVLWKVLVAQSCLTLWDPMDYNPPGSSVHGILQAEILEWVAFPFSKGFSWFRDWTQVSCIEADYLLSEPPGKLGNRICHFQRFFFFNCHEIFSCKEALQVIVLSRDRYHLWVVNLDLPNSILYFTIRG